MDTKSKTDPVEALRCEASFGFRRVVDNGQVLGYISEEMWAQRPEDAAKAERLILTKYNRTIFAPNAKTEGPAA